MTDVVEITSADHLANLVENNETVVIDFWADWCGPCKMLKPNYHQAASRSDAVFTSVDVEALPELTSQFRVMGVPTVLVFKNGELKETPVRARNVDGIVAEVESL